jgi:predicted metalloprotease
MRWTDEGESSDLEDQRGQSGGGGFGGRGLGLGGFVVVALLSVVFRTNLFALLGSSPAPSRAPSRAPSEPRSPQEEKLVHFVSFVLDDVQRFWDRDLVKSGHPYEHAKLVLFTDRVRSGCGFAESAMGPFYCPADRKVYIDLGFYQELKTRFGAPGNFAQAYVIAHEVGHHVQNLLGITGRTAGQEQRAPSRANALSVRVELQADCLAGVWGHSGAQRGLLEAGDLESGLGAAAAVGDDRLQRQATGHVNPESWTHGSSAQRTAWFKRGFERGRVEDCDTFKETTP